MTEGDAAARGYGRTSKILHWTLALLLLGQVAGGVWLEDLDYYDKWRNDLLFWHRAVGVFVLTLAAFRLLWRIGEGWREMPGLQAWERRAAKAAHITLLLLSLIIPISGYVVSISSGAGIPLGGGVELPALFAVSETMREAAEDAHFFSAYALLAVASVHIAAVVKHEIFDGKPTLRRMWRG